MKKRPFLLENIFKFPILCVDVSFQTMHFQLGVSENISHAEKVHEVIFMVIGIIIFGMKKILCYFPFSLGFPTNFHFHCVICCKLLMAILGRAQVFDLRKLYWSKSTKSSKEFQLLVLLQTILYIDSYTGIVLQCLTGYVLFQIYGNIRPL